MIRKEGDFLYYAGVRIYKKLPIEDFNFDKYNINKTLAIAYAARTLITELLYPGTECDFGVFEPFDSERLIFESRIPYPIDIEYNRWNECTFRKRRDMSYMAIDLAGEIGVRLLYPEIKPNTLFKRDLERFNLSMINLYHEIGVKRFVKCSFNQILIKDRDFISYCITEMLNENKNFLEAMVECIYDDQTEKLTDEYFCEYVDELQESYTLKRNASQLYQNLMKQYIQNPAIYAQIRDSFMSSSQCA